MKLRKKRIGFVNRYIPSKDCKHCELCLGEQGGVRGNNQIVDGRAICDYCHANYEKALRYLERNKLVIPGG